MHVMYVEKVVTKCAEILLRNARCHKMRRNFVTKCARCYIMRSCYKMRLNIHQGSLLQSLAIISLKSIYNCLSY